MFLNAITRYPMKTHVYTLGILVFLIQSLPMANATREEGHAKSVQHTLCRPSELRASSACLPRLPESRAVRGAESGEQQQSSGAAGGCRHPAPCAATANPASTATPTNLSLVAHNVAHCSIVCSPAPSGLAFAPLLPMYAARLFARKVAAAAASPAVSAGAASVARRSLSSVVVRQAPPLVKVNVDGNDIDVPGTITHTHAAGSHAERSLHSISDALVCQLYRVV